MNNWRCEQITLGRLPSSCLRFLKMVMSIVRLAGGWWIRKGESGLRLSQTSWPVYPYLSLFPFLFSAFLNTWRIDSFNTRTPKNECGNSCPLPSKKGNTGSWFIRLFVGEGGKPCHMFKFSPSDQNWQYLQGPLPDSQSWALSTPYQGAFCWEKPPSFPEQPGRESPQGSLQNIAIVPNSGSGS